MFKNKKKMSNKDMGAIVGMCCGLPILLIVLVLIFGGGGDDSNSGPDDTGACVMAQQFIEQDLIAPSTAKFQWCHKAIINKIGESKWAVKSYVDSQNGFGAMIRTNYIVRVEYLGDEKWRLLDKEFYE